MAYTTTEQSLAEVIRYHKLHPLRQGIEWLTEEIEHRKQLRDENLRAIKYREVELDELLMRLGHAMRFDYVGFLTSRSRQTFERGISDLKHEQAHEHQAYWKDVIRLKELLQEKLAAYQQAKSLLGPLAPEQVVTQPASPSYGTSAGPPLLQWQERIP